jgi:molybdenum cofactor guanylyltransferase
VSEAATPLGVVLAGGAGTRLGGAKATVELGGRPLIAYPLAAFAAAGIEAIVVAKPETELPPVEARVVTEQSEPTHPILGVVTALHEAGGRPVIACACDMPFVTAAVLTELVSRRAPAAVHDGERLHPLLARYGPADLPVLQRTLEDGGSATSALEALSPALIAADPEVTFNVNAPADLATAAARLRD